MKKTQYTRVSSSLKGPQRPNSPHLTLVAYFHRQVGHPESATPKELKQARALLAQHGEETSRAIVDFALARAAETHFQMEHFGAVLSYVPKGLVALEQTNARRRREDDERRQRQEEDARVDAEREAYFALPAEKRLELRLARRLRAFKTLEGREPTPTEVDDLRERLAVDHRDAPQAPSAS